MSAALLAADGEIIDIDQHGRSVVWEYKDSDEGDCYYCGHVVYGSTKRAANVVEAKGKRKGEQGAWLANGVMLFVFRQVAIPLAERTDPQHNWRTTLRLVPAHVDCMERFSIEWVIADGRKIHRAECVHARADGRHFHGRRREAEWEQERLGFRYRGFCDLCAPIEFWCEPFVGGQEAA